MKGDEAMDKLPDKVIDFTAIQRGRTQRDVCNCGSSARYIIDEVNKTVHCANCGARVEPFQALLEFTDRQSAFQRQTRKLHEQRKEIMNYKPHRVVIKELEKKYNKSTRGKANLGTKIYPMCPCCNEPFDLSEIVNNWQGGIMIQQQLYTRQNKQRKEKEQKKEKEREQERE